jgi:putative SOS response-associated peptidase YedK
VCGRFAFYSPSEATAALFGADGNLAVAANGIQPRYNIAPLQSVAAIRDAAAGGRELVMLRWGLVPSWARDAAMGNRMINARAETVAEKPSFRTAFKHRRCVVLADGFYEWRSEADTRIPYFISLASGAAFALAGLWECWQDKQSGTTLETTALLTTAANDFMRPLHHRMPVILQPETAAEWLAGEGDYLATAAARTPALQAWRVTRRVNNARNQGAELIQVDGEIIA